VAAGGTAATVGTEGMDQGLGGLEGTADKDGTWREEEVEG